MNAGAGHFALIVMTAATLAASTGTAADGGVAVVPSAFNPARIDVRIKAAWTSGAGVLDGVPVSNEDQGLVLSISDTVAYPPGAAAIAEVMLNGGRALRHLAFDHKAGTHCSGGSPRWVVETSDGGVYAFGCSAGVRQVDLPGSGWDRVTFSCSDVQVLAGVEGTCPLGSIQTVSSLKIVHDEAGSTTLDNLDVDFVVTGRGR
jgi:hypothetical protein